MPKYGFLVVEGPHDIEFAYRLLSPFGLTRVQMQEDLDDYFKSLVPSSFPHGGDLQKRVPVPLFLQSSTHAIAIHSAIGDSRLVESVQETAHSLEVGQLTGIGIILDTDDEIAAAERYDTMKAELSSCGYELPDVPGAISGSSPKLGAFVLPDNDRMGNLEDVLIECAKEAFPGLLQSAEAYVTQARDNDTFDDPKREDLSKRSKFNKAVVGAIATTLRPGRAVQTSIQDNIWLRGDNLNLPTVKAVQEFFVELLALEEAT